MPLIGNPSSFAFDLVPVTPDWETRYGPERAAWAGMALWAGGRNLCEHIVPGSNEVRDRFTIPLAPLVDWLVRSFPAIEFEERASVFPTSRRLHEDAARWRSIQPPAGMDEDDWLDARDAWWSRHFLASGADGSRIPNVAVVRNDEHLVITWREPRFAGQDPPRMATPEGDVAVPWPDGQAVLEQLAAQVAAWLRDGQVASAFAWAAQESPLGARRPELAETLALFTGREIESLQRLLGADGVQALEQSLGLTARDDPAASPQCQVLRDLSPSAGSDVGAVLRQVGRAVQRDDADARRRRRDARSLAMDAARQATTPTSAGQLAATELRRALGLDGEPIANLQATLERCGLTHTHENVPGHHDRMMVAAHDSGSAAAVTLETVRTMRSWGQRFEAARALGHALLDPTRSGAMGAASGPYAQDTRRRRSGAFAAELLLPETALAAASRGGLDGAADATSFQRMLEQYGIGARAAAYQLWNRGWLSSPDVRDDLIDRFTGLRWG